MTLARTSVGHRDKVKVKFSPRLQAKPGEKYWITIVEASAGTNAYKAYEYIVDADAIELPSPSSAGDYVRLHGNYPTKTYNLVARAKLTVK